MYFNKDTYSIYYEKHGNSNSIILILPGWGDTRKTFNILINYLKLNHTVYILDYPGFGNSIFPNHDLTIYDYTNIIRDFMKEENIINPIIIAHSFGGRIATLLTGYYKEKVNKLILIDSAGIKPKKSLFKLMKQYTYKLLKKVKYLLPKRKHNIYLKKLFRLFASTDYKALDNNMYQTFKNVVNEDLKYYYKYIEIPTLIIWGEKDIDTPLKDGYYMNKNITNSSLIVYPDIGHFSYLSYPTLTNQIINKFLEEKKDD
ncbi:MAG: alpha/beta hydrolase [Bacilli bacterium]|nr:alpha/beta hydrolase [Bacilli bacterium]